MLFTLVLIAFTALILANTMPPEVPEWERHAFFWSGIVVAAALASIAVSEISGIDPGLHLPSWMLVTVIILGFIYVGLAALTWFDYKTPRSRTGG